MLVAECDALQASHRHHIDEALIEIIPTRDILQTAAMSRCQDFQHEMLDR